MMSANDNKISRATEPPFQPYIPPIDANVVPTNIIPEGTGWSSRGIRRNADGSVGFVSGGLGTKPSSMASYGNSAKMPPKGMSELAYTNWLRNNSGSLNVEKMSLDGLRAFYQNYLNIQ